MEIIGALNTIFCTIFSVEKSCISIVSTSCEAMNGIARCIERGVVVHLIVSLGPVGKQGKEKKRKEKECEAKEITRKIKDLSKKILKNTILKRKIHNWPTENKGEEKEIEWNENDDKKGVE